MAKKTGSKAPRRITARADVVVFPDGAGFRVRPATVIVRKTRGKAKLTVLNYTERDVAIEFPGGSRLLLRAMSDRHGRRGQVDLGTLEGNVYNYEVTVGRGGNSKKARGDSPPRVIIDE